VTTLLLALSPLFPWDHANESALGHHHLIAAYCFTWGAQAAYLSYVGLKWRALGKARRQPPAA
jgi:hypothetical protein